jgi:tetratricopeptide (TPR) repeat protein
MFKYIVGIAAVVICFFVKPWLAAIVIALAVIYMIYSNIPSFYASAGNRAYQDGDYEGALAKYKKACDTGRAKLMIRTTYAFVLMRCGKFEEAENVLNSILALKALKPEQRALAEEYRCMVYYRTGRLEEALEDAEELFKSYKNSSMYGMLGYFKLISGAPLDEVRAFCEEAYEYNSDDRDIVDNMAIVCYKLGDYKAAKEYADELMEKNPSFVEAYYHSALIAEALGDTKRALEYLDKVDGCVRSAMTTVSEEQICELKERLLSGEGENNG